MKPVAYQDVVQFEDEAFMYDSEKCEVAGYYEDICSDGKRVYRHFLLLTPNNRRVQHTETYIEGILDESYIDVDIMNLPWAVQVWHDCQKNGTVNVSWDHVFPGYQVREA